MVDENARVNDRLRKAGEVSLVRWNMSVDEVGEKAEMGSFGAGQRDRVTMWGMFYSCTGYEDDTNR
ncbi:hypothetical protein GB937_003752 [Aspergillus fischeri]|nr:hypothetical protein GB937_003752 [Aspergillus fischeri]